MTNRQSYNTCPPQSVRAKIDPVSKRRVYGKRHLLAGWLAPFQREAGERPSKQASRTTRTPLITPKDRAQHIHVHLQRVIPPLFFFTSSLTCRT